MTNQRDKAINAYQECKNACKRLGVNMNVAERHFYKNFENEPYTREQNK